MPRGEGITLFLIEKEAPGFSVGQKYDMLAHTANPVAELVFDDCRVRTGVSWVNLAVGSDICRSDFQARAAYGARCAAVAQAALRAQLHANTRAIRPTAVIIPGIAVPRG